LRQTVDHVVALGAFAGPASVILGAVLLAVLVPRTAVSLGCGALFGPLAGAGYALAAAALGALLTFTIGRTMGQGRVARRAGPKLARFDRWLHRRGLLAVIVVRLLPLAPFGLIGYAYGATSVRRWHYLVGTTIAAAPSAACYAAVGAAVVAPSGIRLVTVIPALIGVALCAGAAGYWRRHGRRGAAEAAAES